MKLKEGHTLDKSLQIWILLLSFSKQIHAHMRACTHAHAHMHTHTHMGACTHTHTHTHTIFFFSPHSPSYIGYFSPHTPYTFEQYTCNLHLFGGSTVCKNYLVGFYYFIILFIYFYFYFYLVTFKLIKVILMRNLFGWLLSACYNLIISFFS